MAHGQNAGSTWKFYGKGVEMLSLSILWRTTRELDGGLSRRFFR